MKFAYRLGAGLMAGSLLFAGAGGALAAGKATKAVPPAYAYGQVSGVSATGFTLTPIAKKAAAGTTAAPVTPIAVTTSTSTKERALKGTTGTLADNEYALVIGTRSATGITAKRVLFSVKKFRAGKLIKRIRALAPKRVVGAVTGSAAGSLSILTKAGKTFTFSITTKTHFRVNGQAATTAPAFTTGEKVRVVYHLNPTDNTLVANAIAVRQ